MDGIDIYVGLPSDKLTKIEGADSLRTLHNLIGLHLQTLEATAEAVKLFTGSSEHQDTPANVVFNGKPAEEFGIPPFRKPRTETALAYAARALKSMADRFTTPREVKAKMESSGWKCHSLSDRNVLSSVRKSMKDLGFMPSDQHEGYWYCADPASFNTLLRQLEASDEEERPPNELPTKTVALPIPPPLPPQSGENTPSTINLALRFLTDANGGYLPVEELYQRAIRQGWRTRTGIAGIGAFKNILRSTRYRDYIIIRDNGAWITDEGRSQLARISSEPLSDHVNGVQTALLNEEDGQT